MPTKFIPNAVLPPGGSMVKPFEKAIGGYIKLFYDAKVTRFGVDWFRVRGGLSANNDREDWVADLPGVHAGVHDYNWINTGFGICHGSFDDAIKAELSSALQRAKSKRDELATKLQETERSLKMLQSISGL